MATPPKNLVVYDFDWSMSDQDTDRWIFEVNAPDIRRKMEDLEREVQWTDLVAQCLREGHAKGVTKAQILGALRIMPFHPAMIRAVTDLKAKGNTTFLCISNANSVFISTILESKNLSNLFDTIITNPAEWTEDGLLALSRRIPPDGPQHSCPIGCSANMCKGDELDGWLTKNGKTYESYDRIVYIGDGSNDFCPIVKLRSQDLALCRNFGGLKKRIVRDGEKFGLRCQVKHWTGAWEVEETFSEL
ncbi:hypothetical protein BDN72DRAFT_834235 [Pluteus cervinus]|uniref:Uncharacterized protein n=1 Tax=Pluteus cervinus TaxID=181527 RepID=A0ACD3B881_9AGAR|nr:hypothetical protein BDN72DRAFT_834235 [Pluteus cervinus]